VPSSRRSGHRTIYPHVFLYLGAQNSLENAKSEEDGSFSGFLGCIVFTAFFLEAYLNHAGSELIDSWGSDSERLVPKSKLRLVSESVGFNIDYSSPAYQAFGDAFLVRKQVAHGKPTTTTAEWNPSRHGNLGHSKFEEVWERYSTERHAERIFKGAEQLVIGLNECVAPGTHPFISGWSGFSWGPPDPAQAT